ncbi:MAG: sugar phosphate isomerase/epimerase family protein [Limisphaerales bacterium]
MNALPFPASSAWLRPATTLLLALAVTAGQAATHEARAAVPAWPFFAMQTATRDAAITSAEAQVKLVKSLGYDGIGAVPPGEIGAFAAAGDAHGVRLWNTYLVVDINPAVPLDPRLESQVAPLKGRDAMLWVGLTSTAHQPSSPAGDAAAVKRVTALAELAESVGAKVALYPHAGFWVERTEDAVRVANQVDRPNVGVTFNLCHFLKVEDEARLEEVLAQAGSRLFVVSLNGAESGRRGGDWKELIQTLDRGSFDNTRLLRALHDLRYAGPVGFQGYGIGGDATDNLRRTMQSWRELHQRALTSTAEGRGGLRFQSDGRGGFTFDTGQLRGRLHADGKSLGLTEVHHVATGARLDHGYGLLSHYRVFANGKRFGAGAWDWPSQAILLDDGGVEVRWASALDRPFAMKAVYRLAGPEAVEVRTTVEPQAALRGFEVYLASYADAAFTNARVRVKTNGGEAIFAAATPDQGVWQMYPRDAAARALIADGRWNLEPHPVAWTFPAEIAGPDLQVRRRAAGSGLNLLLTASTADCFAVSTPHETEAHYSTYLSLFGRNLEPGESTTARAQLAVGVTSGSDVAPVQP